MSTAHFAASMLRRTPIGVFLVLLPVIASGAAVRTAEAAPIEHFTAFAINLGQAPTARVQPARAGIVLIDIDRWSSEEERAKLLAALVQGGQQALLDALQRTPRVGTIRTPDKLSWDLHYAHEVPGEDGGRRIYLATVRRIAFWEAAYNTRSLQYPFTLIELRLAKNGKGEGKMSYATKIVATADGKHIELEDYTTQPVLLEEVKAQP
jgi:hypothetical protein